MTDDLAAPRRLVQLAPPSEEELVAIVAAIEMAWPRPQPVVAPPSQPVSLPWRFSGRWWSRTTISRRDRPWVGPAH